MDYRLYRRDPVKEGHWYFGVSCKGCGKPIYVLDDNSNGAANTKPLGEGKLSIPCQRCGHDDSYSVTDLRNIKSEEDLDGTRPIRQKTSGAPRKPLWKAYPKAKATFGVGYIEDRPLASSIVGRVVTSWADIEVQCARLLSELMGTQIPAAAAVFGSLRNGRTQIDALNAAAEAVLEPKDLELFSAHMDRRSTLEKERNDLAHGCFGVSVGIPDHVIWTAQADYLAFYAGGADAEWFRKRQFVYELGSLERIAQEIEEFYHQLGSFTGYLRARRHGPNGEAFRAARYLQLCNQPHIQEALDRARTAKKGNKGH